MEQHIERVWREHTERNNRRSELMTALQQLKNDPANPTQFSRESFQKKMEQIGKSRYQLNINR